MFTFSRSQDDENIESKPSEANGINIHLTLQEKTSFETSGPIVGLDFVQEFVSTEHPSEFRMYKCRLFDCDGAWGTSHEFSHHLRCRKHYESYLKEVKGVVDVGKLSDEDVIAKVAKISDPDWSKLETIHDQDRWLIQKGRLASRPIARVRGGKNKIRGNDNDNTADAKRKSNDVDADADVAACDAKRPKIENKARKPERPGFGDDRFDETSYYFDPVAKLRRVYPYFFTFTTFAKGRWVGEKILDVFSREFRAHPPEEYLRRINAGSLKVNGEKIDPDYRLMPNDLLANVVHRHEVPVTSQKIRLIHVDDDLVVVDKPASIPVHPCGRYRHNTVVFILGKENGLKDLCTVHRLDRLTSGLLLFGRNAKKAREMEQQIRTRQVQKEYVCRVEGEFPEGLITCKEPIEVVSYKIGVCKVSPNGKDCHTEFQRLSFNGRTSVVHCRPRTGRMHQIRVHLQYLGKNS